MKKSFVIALITFQLLLLSMIAGRYHYVLLTGAPVKVQVQAVDPMDYFRGQYVALAYPISTWTGVLDDSIVDWSRAYLSLAVSSTGMVDRVIKVSAKRADCENVCIAAKLNHTEIRQKYSIRYAPQTGGGKEQVGEYTQVQYQYASSIGRDPIYDWFKEGEKVEVGSYSGTITYVSRLPDNSVDAQRTDMAKPFADSKAYVSEANGRVEKLLSKEMVSTFEFDASRFYVREGTGYSVERLIRDSKVYANLRIGSDGKSVVESLEYNGSVIK